LRGRRHPPHVLFLRGTRRDKANRVADWKPSAARTSLEGRRSDQTRASESAQLSSWFLISSCTPVSERSDRLWLSTRIKVAIFSKNIKCLSELLRFPKTWLCATSKVMFRLTFGLTEVFGPQTSLRTCNLIDAPEKLDGIHLYVMMKVSSFP